MTKTIYICSDDVEYIEYVENKVREIDATAAVVVCENQKTLFNKIRKIDGLYIICDKLFLGLVLSEKLYFIREFLNNSAKIMITAWHVSDSFFGVRLKNLGFDGFINNIGNDEVFTQGLKDFFSKGTFFDERTQAEYLEKSIASNSKFVSDILQEEIDTVLRVRRIGNAKEVENENSRSTIYNRIASFKKKLGITTDEEVDRVIQQIKKGGLI